MSRVIPAILTDKPDEFARLVRQAETFTDYVQIDIMDGEFVPSRSITWQDINQVHIGLAWEAHLMVKKPNDYFAHFRQAGASKVIFHLEATGSPRKAISTARELKLKAGIAINPETPVKAVLPLVPYVDSVLLLSVHPGFYGARFIPEVMGKIEELRKAYPSVEIGIDGGIKEGNIAAVARNGLDAIYVGSAIFIQRDPAASYRRLSELAR